jgi:amidase
MASNDTPRIIKTDRYAFAFDGKLEPIAIVQPGELLEFHTDDAFCSGITEAGELPSSFQVWPYVNPQTGPVKIEGARAGDTLAVEIISIEPNRPYAVSAHIPGFGGLVASDNTPLLNAPLPEESFVYRFVEGGIDLGSGVTLPYEPFMGTIAVAPLLEAQLTTMPGRFGGNMDCHAIAPGNIVRLPIAVDDGVFFVGDAHANQGDGELCGVALEMTAKVRLRLRLEDGQVVPGPWIESPEEIMCVGSGRPLEEAVREAWVNLIRILGEHYGIERSRAYQLVTHAGRSRIGNVVNPRYSVVASIAKRYLPARVR